MSQLTFEVNGILCSDLAQGLTARNPADEYLVQVFKPAQIFEPICKKNPAMVQAPPLELERDGSMMLSFQQVSVYLESW